MTGIKKELNEFPKLLTLGLYGYTEVAFFGALHQANVDTFCDLRDRRGVRGRDYAFANRRRLETRLTWLGIRYLHCREVAPSPALRRRQTTVDQVARTAKRQRTALSIDFVRAYHDECLRQFDSRKFIERLGPETRAVVLFCVERDPAACHRSLLSARLQEDLGVEVRHLMPDEGVTSSDVG